MAYRIPPRIEHVIRFTAVERLQGAQRQVGDDLELLKDLGRKFKDQYDRHIGSVVIPREGVLITIAAGVLSLALVGIVTSQASNPATVAKVAAPSATAPLVNTAALEVVSDGKDGRSFALAGGIPLFPLPVGTLDDLADKPVELQSVTVQSFIPGVGFWLGDTLAQRVFVVMRPPKTQTEASLALPDLTAGEKVNLSGYIRVLTGATDDMGLADVNDQAQLAMEGYQVEANSVRAAS